MIRRKTVMPPTAKTKKRKTSNRGGQERSPELDSDGEVEARVVRTTKEVIVSLVPNLAPLRSLECDGLFK
jgi:hypothetical protein